MGAPQIFVIGGVPGAGKSAVAAALARRFPRAVLIAGDGLREGFTVVIDGVLGEADPRRRFHAELAKRVRRPVLLRPRLDVAIARNRARTNETFDPERLVPIITRL